MIDVWIYRPDIEAEQRKINRNFLYDLKGRAYWDVVEKKKEAKREIDELLEKKKKLPKTKMEVPYE